VAEISYSEVNNDSWPLHFIRGRYLDYLQLCGMACAGRRQLFGQMPWITILLESLYYVIGHSIAFVFGQLLPESDGRFATRPDADNALTLPGRHLVIGP